MAKNNLRVNTKRDKMIKYVTIHNVYLMNVLNKLCFDFFLGSESRKQAASVGLLYIIGIIAFLFVFKARMSDEEETANTSRNNEAILLLFITGRTIT